MCHFRFENPDDPVPWLPYSQDFVGVGSGFWLTDQQGILPASASPACDWLARTVLLARLAEVALPRAHRIGEYVRRLDLSVSRTR